MKGDDRQLQKVLHEPIAPYLVHSYNILIHLIQGVVLAALFYVISIQPVLNLAVACKIAIAFLTCSIVWHSYLVNDQYLVTRAGMTDTLIPMGFAISKFY